MHAKNKFSTAKDMPKREVIPRGNKGQISYDETASPSDSPSRVSPHTRSCAPTPSCKGGEGEGDSMSVGLHETISFAMFTKWSVSFEEKFFLKLSEVEQSLKLEFNTKIHELEEKFRREQNDMTRKYEKKIADVETQFSHRLSEQDDKIRELATELNSRNTELQHMKSEMLIQRKNNAEKLSQNLVLSGKQIPAASPHEDLTRTAVDIIKSSTKYPIKLEEIISTERFGKIPAVGAEDRRGILVKLHSKQTKEQIVTNNISTRTPDLFINELLTREVSELYRELRKLKRDHSSHIAILHTKDGIIRAKKTRTGRRFDIFTREDLDNFKKAVGITD